MAFAPEAVLTALDAYLSRGGGSRGACAICDPEGLDVPITRTGPLEAFRFRAERKQDRAEKIAIRFENGIFACSFQRVHRHDHSQAAYFERDWAEFLTGAIYALGGWSSASNGTPLQSMAVGSISRGPNSACRSPTAMPTIERPTGNSFQDHIRSDWKPNHHVHCQCTHSATPRPECTRVTTFTEMHSDRPTLIFAEGAIKISTNRKPPALVGGRPLRWKRTPPREFAFGNFEIGETFLDVDRNDVASLDQSRPSLLRVRLRQA
jgi:hypothetical protein